MTFLTQLGHTMVLCSWPPDLTSLPGLPAEGCTGRSVHDNGRYWFLQIEMSRTKTMMMMNSSRKRKKKKMRMDEEEADGEKGG